MSRNYFRSEVDRVVSFPSFGLAFTSLIHFRSELETCCRPAYGFSATDHFRFNFLNKFFDEVLGEILPRKFFSGDADWRHVLASLKAHPAIFPIQTFAAAYFE